MLYVISIFLCSATSDPVSAAVGVYGVVLLFLLLALVLAFFFKRKRNANKKVNSRQPKSKTQKSDSAKKTEADAIREEKEFWTTATVAVAIPQPPVIPLFDPSLPPHLVLAKGSSLRVKAKKMSENTAELEKEYKNMLAYVRENVSRESKISSQDKNKPHNRYLDIGM